LSSIRRRRGKEDEEVAEESMMQPGGRYPLTWWRRAQNATANPFRQSGEQMSNMKRFNE
jgi:hypothetical protein